MKLTWIKLPGDLEKTKPKPSPKKKREAKK